MKIKIAVLFIIAAGILLVAMRPASIPADQFSIAPVSPEIFEQIKAPFITFARVNAGNGISYVGDVGSDTLSLYCKNVPLFVLSNGPGAMYILVFVDQSRRAPKTDAIIERALEQMRKFDQLSIKSGADQVTPLDIYVLKHRDGIDLQSRCD